MGQGGSRVISDGVRFDNLLNVLGQTLAKSVDPDQKPQCAASDQDLHRLPLIQQFYTLTDSKMDLLKRRIR